MIIMNADQSTTDLSAATEPSTLYTNAKGFGPELTKNPFNAQATLGSPMPFPGGYKAGPVRTANKPPARRGIIN